MVITNDVKSSEGGGGTLLAYFLFISIAWAITMPVAASKHDSWKKNRIGFSG